MRRSSPIWIGSEKRRRKAPRYNWTSTWAPALGPRWSSLVPTRVQMWLPAWVLVSVLQWSSLVPEWAQVRLSMRGLALAMA